MRKSVGFDELASGLGQPHALKLVLRL
jgi:hypothetical protein